MPEILTNGEVVLTYAELTDKVKELEEVVRFKNCIIHALEVEMNEGMTSWVSMVN